MLWMREPVKVWIDTMAHVNLEDQQWSISEQSQMPVLVMIPPIHQ